MPLWLLTPSLPFSKWKASPAHAGKLAESLDKLNISANTVLVLQVFDNGVYMVSTEDGGNIPMHRRGTANTMQSASWRLSRRIYRGDFSSKSKKIWPSSRRNC
jgi:hypothetical protein